MMARRSISAPEYYFVCVDIDPTGRRLIDEICQFAAYNPNTTYRQYIMPYNDIDVGSRTRHLLKTFAVGRYRNLKDVRNGKIISTKSEIHVMTDFITWLDNARGTNLVIILTYETHTLTPYLLIEALKRYNLLEKFQSFVAGFVNVHPFIKSKCEMSVSSFSLKTLSKVLLNKDQEEIFSAHDRVRITYQILQHLCAGGNGVEWLNIAAGVLPLLKPMPVILTEIENLKAHLEIQKTLKRFFYDMLAHPQTRKRAAYLKELLAYANLDFDVILQLWEEGKDSFIESLKSKLNEVPECDILEIVSIVECYFGNEFNNPEKRKYKTKWH